MAQVRLALIHDYLQATALRARLYDHGIEAHITEQLNTGSTAGEPALRLGGVSAISSGHPIYVHAENLDEAKQVLEGFAKDHGEYAYRPADVVEEEEVGHALKDYRRKFLLLSVVGGFLMPGYTAPFALYYLWRYIREGGSLISPMIVAGLVIFISLAAMWYFAAAVY